jgi:site-specific recombinase XerD
MEAVNGLSAFLSAAGMPLQVESIRREHVEAFVEDLLASWKPTTAANRYKSLRVFFNWCVDEGEIQTSPMARMKLPKLGEERMRVLTAHELRTLLKVSNGPSFDDRRDTALLMVFIDTGGRLSEIVNLRTADVDLDGLRLRPRDSRWPHCLGYSILGTNLTLPGGAFATRERSLFPATGNRLRQAMGN